MTRIGSQLNTERIFQELRDIQSQAKFTNKNAEGQGASSKGQSFMDHLKAGMKEVNELHKTADVKAMDLAAGKTENLHETMLAASHAELSFSLMVQVRNKILEAYQEVMRMPI